MTRKAILAPAMATQVAPINSNEFTANNDAKDSINPAAIQGIAHGCAEFRRTPDNSIMLCAS